MGKLEVMKFLSTKEATDTARKLCKTAKILDCAVFIEIIWMADSPDLNSGSSGCLIVDRTTSQSWLANVLEGSHIMFHSRLSNLAKMTSPDWLIKKYSRNGLWLEDSLKIAILIELYSLKDKGLSFNSLWQRLSSRGMTKKDLISAIDQLMRAGLVVKAATGGLWWVGYWRKFNRQVGYLPFISPGWYMGECGELKEAKRFYGLKARKNYKPAMFYTGDE